MLNLKKAIVEDCDKIHILQVQSFQSLFKKYNDINTSPAVESVERIVQKMNQNASDYYLIQLGNEAIGAIRIIKNKQDIYRISPMFILSEYQGNGFAQQAIKAVESYYPHAKGWMLETIKEETKLCYLYEKLGYRATGKEEVIQNNMTIVYYKK